MVGFFLLTDDENRVILKPEADFENDYINASYLDVSRLDQVRNCSFILGLLLLQGYTPSKFIATQGKVNILCNITASNFVVTGTE